MQILIYILFGLILISVVLASDDEFIDGYYGDLEYIGAYFSGDDEFNYFETSILEEEGTLRSTGGASGGGGVRIEEPIKCPDGYYFANNTVCVKNESVISLFPESQGQENDTSSIFRESSLPQPLEEIFQKIEGLDNKQVGIVLIVGLMVVIGIMIYIFGGKDEN